MSPFFISIESFIYIQHHFMQTFYQPEIFSTEIITLDADESRHCLKVLRMKRGDTVEVTDGKGNLFTTEIINDREKLCELKIISQKKNYGKLEYKTAVGIALTKNIDRFEWFLEKATEIGIDTIYPMFTERSERSRLNTDRLRKIIVSAMKQSGKAYLPQLHEPRKFQEMMLVGFMTDLQKFIATCESGLPHLKDSYLKGKNSLMLIGPEGDFTENELHQAKSNGFEPVSLGNSKLRVETAGIVACHLIQLTNF